MISFTYAKFLQNICLGICLAIFSLPASAICFYNKINPHDIEPSGFSRKGFYPVKFYFQHTDGLHFQYSKEVSLDGHQCIGAKGGSAAVSALVFLDHYAEYATETSTLSVTPHGYVVLSTQPVNMSGNGTKYFKLIISSYSKSNALQKTVVKNMSCTLDNYLKDLSCRII